MMNRLFATGLSHQRLQRGLLLGSVVAGLILFIWVTGLFSQLQLALSNIYFVPSPVSDSIIIVAIDDATLAEYGRSPTLWSRRLYANLVAYLNAAQARVVAFDLLFVEPSPNDAAFAAAIQQARDSETATRVVLPIVGIQRSSSILNAVDTGLVFDEVLKPTARLYEVMGYSGYVNAFPDTDGRVRRDISLVKVGDETRTSFTIATYLAYLRIPEEAFSQLVRASDGLLKVTPQRSIPVDAAGFWIQNYFGPPYSPEQVTFPVVSLRAVLNDEVDANLFKDKIVLVGLMNSSGFTDQYPVPSSTSGRMMAGVEIHANAVESLLQNRFLYEQSNLSQVLTIVLVAVGASLVYAHLRWYWMLAAGGAILLAVLFYAFISFTTRSEITNLLHPIMAVTLPILAHIAYNNTVEARRRQKAEFLLESVVQASNQRLVPEKIIHSLAGDMQRALEVQTGAVWLWDNEQAALTLKHQWSTQTSPALDDLAQRVLVERQQVVEGLRVALPIIWQGELVGVIAAALPSRWRQRPLELLENLAGQIAPSLENARLHSQVQRQKSLVETVLASSPAGIVVLDSDLRLLSHNAALHQILQFAPETTVLPGFFDALAKSQVPDDLRAKLQESFTTQQPFRQELTFGGSSYNLDAAPISDYQQWVVIFSDVTALSELNRLKTRMIRMASHDLKNPLSRVQGYGDLILTSDMEGVSQENRRFLENILKAADEMGEIITQILDLEHARSAIVQYQNVDLVKIVHKVIAQQRADLNAKRQTLIEAIPEEAVWVSGSESLLSEVVKNLLGNASKYTPDEGRITLRLYRTHEGRARLEIEDTGYGIPEEAQKDLFSEFYRVRTKETAHIKGTGLGLSLVKSVVESHRGRVWVQSQEGVGSTFFVELPALKPSE